MCMTSVTEVVRSEIESWKKFEFATIESPEDINNGYCSQFAKSVKDTMGNPDGLQIKSYGYTGSYQSTAHKWVYYEGKHYDAECPEGVDEASKLPIFVRNDIEVSV